MNIIKNNRLSKVIKLSQQAFGKYKLQIIVLTILGFLSGILEGIGVNAVIPLFSFIAGKKGGAGDDLISQAIEKLFLYLNIDFSLKYLLIFICFLFIFKAIVLVICSYINIKITANYEEETRNDLLKVTLGARWSYLLKQKLGYLDNILVVDVAYSAMLLRYISTTIMILTGLFVYILVAINISVFITLLTLALGGILFLIFKPLIYRTRIVSRDVEEINKQMSHYINENIFGIKTIKAMSVSKKVIGIGREYFYKRKKFRIILFLLKNITGSLLQPISLIFVCIIFAISYKAQNFHFAAMVAVIYLIQRIFQYIQQLQTNLHSINESVPYLQRVLFYKEDAIKNSEINKGLDNFSFNNVVEIKNVNFSYNNGKQILSNINFNIKKGEMVGLIGSSGTGKTTIVDLFLRLFNPIKGKILVDGQDIANININEWRKNIGYVSQDIFLLNGTIADNIKFYDNTISEKEIIIAAKKANIYDFIESCHDKFKTQIGERGVLLSAGQRQRIIIARILARKPKILILDEATSALDNESELKIQKVIENLKGEITVFVIAHRLSTVINCDRLLVLNKGRIVEEGSPKNLLKDKNSYFYKTYNIRR